MTKKTETESQRCNWARCDQISSQGFTRCVFHRIAEYRKRNKTKMEPHDDKALEILQGDCRSGHTIEAREAIEARYIELKRSFRQRSSTVLNSAKTKKAERSLVAREHSSLTQTNTQTETHSRLEEIKTKKTLLLPDGTEKSVTVSETRTIAQASQVQSKRSLILDSTIHSARHVLEGECMDRLDADNKNQGLFTNHAMQFSSVWTEPELSHIGVPLDECMAFHRIKLLGMLENASVEKESDGTSFRCESRRFAKAREGLVDTKPYFFIKATLDFVSTVYGQVADLYEKERGKLASYNERLRTGCLQVRSVRVNPNASDTVRGSRFSVRMFEPAPSPFRPLFSEQQLDGFPLRVYQTWIQHVRPGRKPVQAGNPNEETFVNMVHGMKKIFFQKNIRCCLDYLFSLQLCVRYLFQPNSPDLIEKTTREKWLRGITGTPGGFIAPDREFLLFEFVDDDDAYEPKFLFESYFFLGTIACLFDFPREEKVHTAWVNMSLGYKDGETYSVSLPDYVYPMLPFYDQTRDWYRRTIVPKQVNEFIFPSRDVENRDHSNSIWYNGSQINKQALVDAPSNALFLKEMSDQHERINKLFADVYARREIGLQENTQSMTPYKYAEMVSRPTPKRRKVTR